MKGLVSGLDPGQQYYVEVTSHRNQGGNYKQEYITLEVTTPGEIP
jgi:hypothetical protein